MRVLVGCEFSGVVRNAFRDRGHEAWSCDYLPTEQAGNHTIGNVIDMIELGWDLAIFHPPCTYLCSSGLHWNKRDQSRSKKTEEALKFVEELLLCDIPKIALENPIGCISTRIRKPDQIIQPWQFGHGETKATCLWLKGLPKLMPTNIVSGREARVHRESPGPDRWKKRSLTYEGIAKAMASQWV